ncbi:MAG TPA: 2-dehydropantoate 2-reductase [Actinomycetales bacterium]
MPALRVCVVGPGAVGGVLAGALHRGGAHVSLLGRPGAHLDALQERGLVLRTAAARGEDAREVVLRLQAASDARDVGPVDVVVLAVKTTGLWSVAPAVRPLLHAGTVLVPAVNGVPWWFLHGLGGRLDGHPLASVDPGGVLTRHLDPARVVGCVVHLAASVPEAGVVAHASGRGLILGDASRPGSARVRPVTDVLTAGGLEVTLAEGPAAIREQVWVKLLGNVSFNPVSALTGATLEQIATDPAGARTCGAIITETARVGEALGITVDITTEQRIAMARRLGAVRTSMLQDADAGRPLETGALVGAVSELGALLAVPTPVTDAVLALLQLRGSVLTG